MELPGEIPDDIKEAARAALLPWQDGEDVLISDVLEAALLAERLSATERAAKIADDLAESAEIQNAKFDRPSLDFQRWAEGCRNVARRIRSQP